jgi:hypothetical protein
MFQGFGLGRYLGMGLDMRLGPGCRIQGSCPTCLGQVLCE